MRRVILPVRVALRPLSEPLRIREPGDRDGGWSTIACESVEHARQIMREHPSAEMPCWRNPSAEWNR